MGCPRGLRLVWVSRNQWPCVNQCHGSFNPCFLNFSTTNSPYALRLRGEVGDVARTIDNSGQRS